MCANLRRAARAVTQLYEDELRPTGMRVSQFTLLQSLTLAPGISQKKLARLLEFDTTTLSRTLDGLRKKGWLVAEAGADRRELRLSLSAAGQKEFRRVMPYWQAAQKRLRRELGETRWNALNSAAIDAAGIGLSRLSREDRDDG